jgi:hypothetical protein
VGDGFHSVLEFMVADEIPVELARFAR